MKHSYILPCLLMVAGAWSACTHDEGNTPSKKVAMTFYAGTETDTSLTRACLQSNNDVFWQTGDEISIMHLDGNENPVNDKFSLVSGDASCKGFFAGLAEQSYAYIALYPYQSRCQVGFSYTPELTAVVNNAIVPTLQTPTANTFDRQAALQLSNVTTNNTLAFYNVTSLLKLTPKFDCTAITIETQDSLNSLPVALTGTAKLYFSNLFPIAEIMNSTGSKQVVMCGDIRQNTTYYIAVLPSITAKQFKITYRNGDKSLTEFKGTAPIQLNRAGIKNIPTPDVAPAPSELVDLGLSVLWSTQNLGAASPTEKGTLYAWGETAPKQDYTEYNYRYYGISSAPSILEDDIASFLSGGKLRMPTQVEVQELLDNCTFKLEKNGYTVTSKKIGYETVSIFLPFVRKNVANYWSSSVESTSKTYTLFLGLDNSEETPVAFYKLSSTGKYEGWAIRPVAEK